MGKISDIWVRLGLKKEGFEKGIEDAKRDTQSFGDKLGKIKAGAVAAWAAIGSAIVKVAQDTINATNMMGDVWAKNMAKVKASYRSVIAQMSTNGKREKGWWLQLFNPNGTAGYDVGANAKAAGEAAAKMTEAFDAEFELVNSVRLQRAAIQQELNQLYMDMRDTTLSPQARQSAMERYKALLEPIAQAEISVYQNMLNAAVEGWQAGNMDILSRQYSTAELTDFFSMYGTDPNAARSKYGELVDVYELRQNDEFNQLLVDTMLKLQAAQAEMSNTEREMSRVAMSIKNGFEAMTVELEELDEELDDIILDVDVPEIKSPVLDARLQQIRETADAYREEIQRIAEYNAMLENSFISAASNGLQALADLMMGVEGADMKNVLAAFIAPFGDTMKQMGAMIMAEGVAMEAFKASFKTPGAAIAAGAALMALGSVVSAGLQKLTANPVGGGTGASVGSGSYGASELTNYESTLTVEVVGKISGSDILLAGKKQQNKWNR